MKIITKYLIEDIKIHDKICLNEYSIDFVWQEKEQQSFLFNYKTHAKKAFAKIVESITRKIDIIDLSTWI